MIRGLTKGRVQEAAARIWTLAQEPSARCYPLVRDEADIERTLLWALQEETGHARAYWKDGALAGVCCFHAEPARSYAQIVLLYAWDDFRRRRTRFCARWTRRAQAIRSTRGRRARTRCWEAR